MGDNGKRRSKICGVYKIVNPVGEIYVGSSEDIIGNRWNGYKHENANGATCLLKESLLKYKPDAHVFEIVQEFPSDVDTRTLRNYETFVWEQFNEAGYKMLCINPSSSGTKGKIVSEETRSKMSEYGKKRVYSEETRNRMSVAHKGIKRKQFSEETKMKMSQPRPWQKGKKRGPYKKTKKST